MRIDRNNRTNVVKKEVKINSSRQGFSGSFGDAMERRSEEQLKEMIEDIKKKGAVLVTTKTYRDVVLYKKMIKEYLQSILQHMYNTKKNISFWQTQYFIMVETIDRKLEELTKAFVDEEIKNMNLAATIDEIQGLILDIYK